MNFKDIRSTDPGRETEFGERLFNFAEEAVRRGLWSSRTAFEFTGWMLKSKDESILEFWENALRNSK